MKQRSILVTLLLCVLLLTGCGTAAPAPDATSTPTQEAAAAPTPTPDPLSTLPYEDGQLYAAAYLGYLEPKDLDFFRQTYFGGRELPVHHISDGDFYLIIPRDPNATVRLLRNDMLTQTSSIIYEQPDGSPSGCFRYFCYSPAPFIFSAPRPRSKTGYPPSARSGSFLDFFVGISCAGGRNMVY